MSATDPEGDDLVPLSALNALLYCERRAALRHLDALYVHNEHTRRGDLQHRRADKAGVERRRGVRTERGLWVVSRRLRLYGRADLVEFRRVPLAHGSRRRGPEVPYPVEYKQGRKRRWDNDDVQLCAVALCLEEALCVSIPEGAIYHAKSQKRRVVPFEESIRAQTEAAVVRLHELLRAASIPPAILKPQCKSCSLRGHCLPEAADRLAHPNLARELFRPNLSDPTGAPGLRS
jgi:CRISPR-associated exonuclease Cas4